MNLSFLPDDLIRALKNLNLNHLTEIRLRSGQPVIIQYRGEYKYINSVSSSDTQSGCIVCGSAQNILLSAMENSVYAFSEQMKRGFITVDGGVRIGIAGEYVSQDGKVVTIKNVSSLNVRIPHDVVGAASELHGKLCRDGIKNILLFSPPGYGKTTMLRDFARVISRSKKANVLIFDERNEISGLRGDGGGFKLGVNCDVVRGTDKLSAFVNAVRVMRPQVIITDELSGPDDIRAAEYAAECGIALIASSHTTDKQKLKMLPFEYFVELSGIGKNVIVYDKDFNIICDCASVGRIGTCNIG